MGNSDVQQWVHLSQSERYHKDAPLRHEPLLYRRAAEPTDNKPVLVAKVPLRITGSDYVVIKNDDSVKLITDDLKKYFDSAEQRRKEIAGTIKTETPDPFISPLGGVLSTAADCSYDLK